MPFRLEKDMVAPAVRWLKSQGLMVKHEFSTPWGICDLAGCSFNAEHVKLRRELGQRRPIGPQLRVSILLLIPDERSKKRGATIQDLAEKVGPYVPPDRVREEVDRLAAGRFVHVTRKGTYLKRNGWIPLHERLVAIELKRHRIEEVLTQARANVGFADESFVGLPLPLARRLSDSPRVEAFRHAGIGILGIRSNRAEVVLQASTHSCAPFQATQAHCVERFWRGYLRDTGA